MAIIKELQSSYGVNPNYHRVLVVSINAVRKEVTICVGSYITKEARDKGYEAVDSIDIVTPKEDYNRFLNGDIIKAAYLWLKENVEGFEDSIDG